MAGPPSSELARLFEADVLVGIEPCVHDIDTLWPEERPLVSKAVLKRQREFSSARVLARRLLVDLGHAPAPILPDEDRCPQWPSGVVGSISHTRHLCLVAVASAQQWASIGVDIEPHDGIELELTRMICTTDERRWLDTQPVDERGVWARRFFCAKEAFYKAQFPLTRRKLGFKDVVVDFDLGSPAANVAFHITVIGDASRDYTAVVDDFEIPLCSSGRVVAGETQMMASVGYRRH